MKIKDSVVAGSFYSADPAQLKKDVADCFADVEDMAIPNVRAIIVPHAGYIYSGKTAAKGFRQVGKNFNRVILMGCNHNAEAMFSGIALPDAEAYQIPGATLPVDTQLLEDLKKHEDLFVDCPKAHDAHILEVELPFLQHLQDWNAEFQIIPLVFGYITREQIDQAAEILKIFANDDTLFVISSDFSHFHSDKDARKIDQETIELILGNEVDSLISERLCGSSAVQTLLKIADNKNWQSFFVDYTNSGETSGDLSRVVGYASIAFAPPPEFSQEQKDFFKQIARDAILAKLNNEDPPTPDIETNPILRIKRSVFVTLHKHGELRGCIGTLFDYTTPLWQNIQHYAQSAAFSDPRFPPVTLAEMPDIEISLSILNFPKRVYENPENFDQCLTPHKDGAILVVNNTQSTFIPEVWNEIATPREFLQHLCIKQGAPPHAWKNPSSKLYTYQAS